MTRYAMVIDLARCIGCDACAIACKAEHATPRGVLWTHVLKYETGTYPHGRIHYLPVQCNHCSKPECEKVCPAGAISRRDDGIVTVDNTRCMGCGYCTLACPYASLHNLDTIYPYYEKGLTPFESMGYSAHRPGTSGKCDLCVERVDRGLQPACVNACVAQARFFGDMEDPKSEVYTLVHGRDAFVLSPESGTEPSCYYLPERQAQS